MKKHLPRTTKGTRPFLKTGIKCGYVFTGDHSTASDIKTVVLTCNVGRIEVA